jgi:S1-C subfamily serine protease
MIGFVWNDISSGSPADKAGIQGGYKIDNINRREIALGYMDIKNC